MGFQGREGVFSARARVGRFLINDPHLIRFGFSAAEPKQIALKVDMNLVKGVIFFLLFLNVIIVVSNTTLSLPSLILALTFLRQQKSPLAGGKGERRKRVSYFVYLSASRKTTRIFTIFT